VSLGGVSLAAGAHGAVQVTVEPPAVAYVEFDPRRPPDDLPGAGGDGAGVCQNVFEIEASISSSIEVLSPTAVRAFPTDFDIITRLRVTIFTPHGSPQQLLEHENGHRRIGEYYYRAAESAAREAAASLQGAAFEADGPDRAAAEQAVGEQVLAALKDGFMTRTHARSAAANARYDSLTRHGLAAIAEADAVAAALAQDP
jgi:hypothetical protein